MVKPAKKDFLALGLMSGTSMDGVDCALIRSNGITATAWGQPVHKAYDPAFRQRLSAAMTDWDRPQTAVEKDLTLIHAAVVQDCLDRNNLDAAAVDVIGFHGQTLYHCPQDGISLQIGDGALLADCTGITVVNDFRSQDIKAGGQGAPLVPVYHQTLARRADIKDPIAIINIGGVSNITWIGSGQDADLLAFDCGPGNALLDDWIARHTSDAMDYNGQWAAKGNVDTVRLARWLDHDYFRKPPPKSLDRQAFDPGPLDDLSLADGAASLLAFTVAAILAALDHCPAPPLALYICGGGRHNKTLMEALGQSGIPVAPVEALGWQGDFIEAEAFAFLACRHLADLPITFPTTTGSLTPVVGGRLWQPHQRGQRKMQN